MEKTNKILIAFLFVMILQSCQILDFNKSVNVIQKLENQNNNESYQQYNFSERSRKFQDSLYKIFFEFRKNDIKAFIKKRKLKDFILKESFDFDDVMGTKKYIITIIRKDSVYTFLNVFNYSKKYVDNLEYYNSNNAFYYLYKKDSIFIYKNLLSIDYNLNTGELLSVEELKTIHYFSNYRNGKIDQFTINDSIIYKRKGSKMVVDLKKIAWIRKEGDLCIDDRRTDNVQCGDIRYGNCIRNEVGNIMYCDTLK